MTDISNEILELRYMRVRQKGMSFFISKASAADLRRVVDFHFREPYKEYTSYRKRDFDVLRRELEVRNVSVTNDLAGGGVQRSLSRQRVREITEYIQDDPEAVFPSSVLLAIDTTQHEAKTCSETEELGESGIFVVTSDMGVTVIDGQHRLAGLFLASEETIQQVEMPIVFMLNVSVPTAAKLFQYINGKQQKVNKSVVFDLFDNVPEESIDDADELETKRWHTVCVNLYTNSESPLYRQIKMLGVGGGAISQAFFIDTCKKELRCLRDRDDQERFDLLWDYFELIQNLFPEDWPRPCGNYSNGDIDSWSRQVLKERKSQLCKTNGITAILRLLDWMMSKKIDIDAVKCLYNEVNWTESYGTGAAAQARLFENLKGIVVRKMGLKE